MIDIELAHLGTIAISFFLGILLSGGYFIALWLTLRRLPHCRRPALLLISSLLARLGLLLIVFYLILKVAHWDHLLAALIGFIMARILLARRLGPNVNASSAQSHSEMPS